ncbi:MAG TPA: sugar ABC transporter ATP-binding protein [Clostridiales bacterium]|nr:sugar ABC transporter ATP-binding protein [Clostridiales bacterium]
MSYISVENISKEFKIYHREKGFANIVKSMFARKYSIKKAVENINFSIDKGELVGYVGPNGAGKSTTIKMLSGILIPTSGKITVDGRIPYENRQENAMHIGVVFGQRSQLFWDLPVEDTFDLYRKMYLVDKTKFKRNLEFYTDLLEMKDFIKMPVRQLSLGQKMRANIAIALLHDPEIVYLDEPTIGLDVLAKENIRKFIQEVNKEKKTTVILTTHDMDDIEQICNRLIMIDKGQIIYDGKISDFKKRAEGENVLIVEYGDTDPVDFILTDTRIKLLQEEGKRKWFKYCKTEINTAEVISFVTKDRQVQDILLKEPEIEDIVKKMYRAQQVEVVS